MSDPRTLLTTRLAAALDAAFGPEVAGTDPAVRRSDRTDYQANVAMALAKRLKKSPRDVAQAIAARLDVAGICDKVEIAGPGFLNLTLDARFLARETGALAAEGRERLGDRHLDRLGIAPADTPETIVIDYSAPNVAKEMHVGHLRSTIIGDALARMLELLGHRVIRQNHVGDWGTPFGMLIEHLLEIGDDPAARADATSDLTAFYKAARSKFDADPAFADRARRRVVSMQGGDAPTLALWRTIVDASRRYFASVYDKLGVTLTDADVCGESFFNSKLAGVVDELSARGLAVESEGALCIFLDGWTGKDGQPVPLIVRKQDGGYGYATTDLAAVRYRTATLGATCLLYVVGSPQQQHLAMVFEAAKRAGWLAPPAHAEHVAFGSVLGADKKMFKTRSGDTVRLVELIDEAIERADAVVRQKNPELDDATRADVARKVGVGAIKYADLSSDRIKDYVFDWDRMLAFEGNTAPYLMYAHARIRSIFRRGEATLGDSALALDHPAERALALELVSLPTAVHAAAQTREPHRLCTYLFQLASTFTTFYESCPVLKADGAAQRESRLLLCDLTARVLARGLGLLGIEAPDRM